MLLLESKLFWIEVFYAWFAVCLLFTSGIYRVLNRRKFRSEEVESTEVGYEEDSEGRVRRVGPSCDVLGQDEDVELPHFDPIGNANSGPM